MAPESYLDAIKGKPVGELEGMLIRAVDRFKDIVSPALPPDMYMVPQRRQALQEDPDFIYPNSQLPCLDQTFALIWDNNAANSALELTQASLASIQLLTTGQSDSGASLNLWWPQTYADTTLQKNGTFVYRGHTFWGTAHSIAYEGAYYRIGAGTAADALVSSRTLMDGAGSYSEQALQLAATRVGLEMQPAGSQCPIFLGNLAYTGDQAQVRGAGLPTVSDPQLPFKRWERPINFGSRDSPFEMNAQLTMGPQTIGISYTGGNPPAGDLVQIFRLRICGFRECGEYVPGCRVTGALGANKEA